MKPTHKQNLQFWRERAAAMLKSYKDGVAKADIAREHGVTSERVAQIIKKEESRNA